MGPLRKENWGADGTNAEKMPSQPAQTTGAKLRPGRGCSGREDAAVLGPATKGDAEPGTPAARPARTWEALPDSEPGKTVG